VVKAEVMSGPDGLPGRNEINANASSFGYATADGVLLDMFSSSTLVAE
jgi:hypothetical protein